MAGELDFDIAVIGAGIAGSSAAAELAAGARVVLLEREAQPGYHATGRSAALLAQNYGSRVVRALTRIAEPFLAEDAPDGPLLTDRGLLRIARPDQTDLLRAQFNGLRDLGAVRWLDAAEAEARVPLLRRGYVGAAFLNEAAKDIDVHALLQRCLRRFRRGGGTLIPRAEVRGVGRSGRLWRLETHAGSVTAGVLVNAAGAWADAIAALAGVAPVGLAALRRTAITVAAPAGLDVRALPMVVDAGETFYLKPDAGRLLASPADETPSAPCDSRPEEIDVAICVDRITRAFDLDILRIASRWSGLRSSVPDRLPVCGFDSAAPGFFWLAGQGGYGVQTAPALARLTAALVLGRPPDPAFAEERLGAELFAPGRLRAAA